MGVDWGATHPACVLWFQYLTCEVPALDFNYQPIWLAPGTYILFREIYTAGIDAGTLGKRVIEIENGYRNQFDGSWTVAGRFADPQGKGDRITWKNLGLKTYWPVKTRNKERMITTVQNIVIDDKFAVDVEKASVFCEEVETWQKKPDGKELDKFNHAMASWRYGIANAEIIEGKERAKYGDSERQPRDPDRRKKTGSYVTADSLERNQVNYGSIAAVGGSGAPLDPNFVIQKELARV
jgi:hypothetical protein